MKVVDCQLYYQKNVFLLLYILYLKMFLLPALNLLVLISIFGAILLLVNIRRRGWLLPSTAIGLWLAVSVIVGGIVPAAIQRFRVLPDELNKELPYVAEHINYTRIAYGLDEIEERAFEASPDLTQGDINDNSKTVDNIRLWDPTVLAETYSQLQEIRAYYALKEVDVDRYVIDGKLTPIQQRNLERNVKVKVIDRTRLILDIFERRATTREGSLQVELAQLDYQKTRLVKSWTHLERQRGSLSFVGGPGESQLEIDKRLINDQIIKVKKKLKEFRNTRKLHRNQRTKKPYYIVALVGYTNAGKSTLFNSLTGEGVLSKDMLFATLDTKMKRLNYPNTKNIILTDTVGFISALPTELIMAFRSTLEELLYADIVINVRDLSSKYFDTQNIDVMDTIEQLGKQVTTSNYIEVLIKLIY